MSLHALACCERLSYLEEVEEMRVADERVYAGRRLHVEINKKEDQRTRKGNVVAQPDIVRRNKKPALTDNPTNWPSALVVPLFRRYFVDDLANFYALTLAAGSSILSAKAA